LGNTKRLGRYDLFTNNNNPSSPSYFEQLASLYKDIDWKPVFPSKETEHHHLEGGRIAIVVMQTLFLHLVDMLLTDSA
jgi:hypothetical protein